MNKLILILAIIASAFAIRLSHSHQVDTTETADQATTNLITCLAGFYGENSKGGGYNTNNLINSIYGLGKCCTYSTSPAYK